MVGPALSVGPAGTGEGTGRKVGHVADDDGPVEGGSIDDGDGPDPFDGVTFDESWVQAARRSEDDAETRVAKLQRIDADYRRVGSEKQTLASDAAKATRRARNKKRLIIGLVVVVLAGLGTVSFLRQRSNGRTTAAPRPSTTTTSASTTTTLGTPPPTMAPELLVNGRLPDGHLPLFQCLRDHTPTASGYDVTAVSCDGPFQVRQTWVMSDQVADLSDEKNRGALCVAYGFADMSFIDSFDQVPSTDQANKMFDAMVTAGLAIDDYYAPPGDGQNGSLMCVIGFKESRTTTAAELDAAIDGARAQLGLPPKGGPTAPSTTTTAPPLNTA